MLDILQASVDRLRALMHLLPRQPETEYNEPGSPVWQRTGFMHRQRYEFAAKQVTGKRVLNVGCGPGYGEGILASGSPAAVVAVDYDFELVERLRRKQASANECLEYRWANAEALPDSLGKFDVIISFENIEHLPAPDRFLEGVRRVANPGARLILSTPNRIKYSGHPQRPVQNPFHVREYDFDELRELLAPTLADMQWSGQFERDYTALSDEVEAALRTLNSLWFVRMERAGRQLLGMPAPAFHFLPFETDLRPLGPDASNEADTFVVAGTIR
jgi:SAM-dependent methyltransferase